MNIYDLIPGSSYQVIQPIQGFHGDYFAEGVVLEFVEKHYLPHDDGHTLVFLQEREWKAGSFQEVQMYLQGEQHREILNQLDLYLEPV